MSVYCAPTHAHAHTRTRGADGQKKIVHGRQAPNECTYGGGNDE